jgi:hypothetical protein
VRDPQGKRAWLAAVIADPDRSGCRDWPWSTSPKGYGQLSNGGRLALVSHLVLEATGRPRPAGQTALHSCDRPVCAAPWHLRWGTQRENTADMMSRGRQVAPTGLANGKAVLSDEQAREIRRRFQAGETSTSLAQEYGINRSHAYRIGAGKRRQAAA